MMDEALSPSELASTQMRLKSDLQLRTLIASAGVCQRGWDTAFECLKSTPASCVEGQKAKGFKDTHLQKAKWTHFDKYTGRFL